MPPAYPSGNRLEGKVALISGGARGMGESHARAMVAQGAKVVIGDILDAEGEAVAAELGDAAVYVHLDVTDRDQWAAAVATAVERFGRLNVLVNNAGIATFGPIGEYTPEQWDTIIAINLTGVFNGIHASVEALKAGAPSSIINISSTAGLRGYPSLSGYNAAKFGLRGLTKSVALDLGSANVRCNSVHPGGVTTPDDRGPAPCSRSMSPSAGWAHPWSCRTSSCSSPATSRASPRARSSWRTAARRRASRRVPWPDASRRFRRWPARLRRRARPPAGRSAAWPGPRRPARRQRAPRRWRHPSVGERWGRGAHGSPRPGRRPAPGW